MYSIVSGYAVLADGIMYQDSAEEVLPLFQAAYPNWVIWIQESK